MSIAMSPSRFLMYICLLVVGNLSLLSLNVQGVPLVIPEGLKNDLVKPKGQDSLATKSEPLDVSYQNEEEFKKEINDKVDELAKNKGAMFDRILLVNSIHKRWKKNYDGTKRSWKRNAEDNIIRVNTMDYDDYFEGDIILDKNEKELINAETGEDVGKKRNAVYQRKKIWTSRQVPYIIDAALLSNSKATKAIYAAFKIIHSKTCIRWVNYNPSVHTNYVKFIRGSGCYSKIGKKYFEKGPQDLSIGEGCEFTSTALHEMTHAMGFFHEQSRDDRDKYVKIIWENIPVTYQDQFEKYSHGTIDKMDIDYDYNSIMHYSATAFGGGKVTIQPIDAKQSIGNAEIYTTLDVVELNALYDCKTKNVAGNDFSSWSHWSECDTNCYKERQRFCFHANKINCPGSSYYGIITDRVKCAANECPAPVDGNWGNWASWSACSRSCDEGKRQRSRKCNKPAPDNNGKFCVGERAEASVCLNRRCNIGPDDVDFEDGLGMWSSDSTAGIQWLKLTGPVKTLNTGPLGDHTLQGLGQYIYVESSRPAVKGNEARLYSKTLEFSSYQCMSFYYTMHGAMMGSLTLWITPVGSNTWMKKFLKSGDQGTEWKNADVTLDYTGKFQLVFQAILGGTGTSDIALDDIFIDSGACPGYVASTSVTPVTNACKDIETSCPAWAKSGECQKNPDYMRGKCTESCPLLCPANSVTPVTNACKDMETSCPAWAKSGECQKNPGYMREKCTESCPLLCPANSVTPVTNACKDMETSCPAWAKSGECQKNPDYMREKCTESCPLLCPANSCADDKGTCSEWAGSGECQKNPGYMKTYCKASCGFCGECEDKEKKSNCEFWANNGYCKKSLEYMMKNCKKSCTGCPACEDGNAECPKWAGENECGKNPEWMGVNCKKSCGKC